MRCYSLELMLLFVYQAELPGAKGSLLYCECQAGLPTDVASHCFDACLLISSKSEWGLVRLIVLTRYSGLLSLKIFNQMPSNRTQIKYPVVIEENISNSIEPLSNDIKGSIKKQPKNRISLTLGNCLANCKSCSEDIFQSLGMRSGSGKVCHNLSLNLYNAISTIVPTIGYTAKQVGQKLFLVKNNPKKRVLAPLIMLFGTIAKSPDSAIIVGLLKSFSSFIVSLKTSIRFTKIHSIRLLRIAQNNLNLHTFLLKEIL